MWKMFRLILLLLLYALQSLMAYGYDSGGDQGACGRQFRSGRMRRPPCDLSDGGYCTSAGSAYPWHAVKRFVRENQGLMRRMYGDQSHGQVLQDELDTSEQTHHHDRTMFAKQDIDFMMENELFRDSDNLSNGNNEPRFLRDEDISNDDVLNTKFVYSEEPSVSIKLSDLRRTAPHFRPMSTTTTTQKTTTSTSTTTSSSKETNENKASGLLTTTESPLEVVDLLIKNLTFEISENENDQNVSSTSGASSAVASGEEAQDLSGGGVGETVLFQDMEDERDKNKIPSGSTASTSNNHYQVVRGVNACPVKEEVVAPFWANNTRGEVLALLNMYPFEQYVHWEKCTHEHKQMYCRDGCRCEQQYRLHRLLAYDPNNECRGIFSDWFRFPSCCVCKCYTVPPAEFRVTSRSPRSMINIGEGLYFEDWYTRRKKAEFAADHG